MSGIMRSLVSAFRARLGCGLIGGVGSLPPQPASIPFNPDKRSRARGTQADPAWTHARAFRTRTARSGSVLVVDSDL